MKPITQYAMTFMFPLILCYINNAKAQVKAQDGKTYKTVKIGKSETPSENKTTLEDWQTSYLKFVAEVLRTEEIEYTKFYRKEVVYDGIFKEVHYSPEDLDHKHPQLFIELPKIPKEFAVIVFNSQWLKLSDMDSWKDIKKEAKVRIHGRITDVVSSKQQMGTITFTNFVLRIEDVFLDSTLDAHTDIIKPQVWMAENLNVSTYRNGDIIPQVQDSAAWVSLKTGAWCYYENKRETGIKYGKLYNWYAVNDPRGLAPKGWHIPTDEEWIQLTVLLGGGKNAGARMKSTSSWNNYKGKNSNGSNSSGFSGFPGGYRSNGTFLDVGNNASWWSSTGRSYDEYIPTISMTLHFDVGWTCSLLYSDNGISRVTYDKGAGLSVRCIKD